MKHHLLTTIAAVALVLVGRCMLIAEDGNDKKDRNRVKALLKDHPKLAGSIRAQNLAIESIEWMLSKKKSGADEGFEDAYKAALKIMIDAAKLKEEQAKELYEIVFPKGDDWRANYKAYLKENPGIAKAVKSGKITKEKDIFKSKFDERIVTPAQEPDFGKKPKIPAGPDKEKKKTQASIVPNERPSGKEDASELVIPPKFSDRVKKIGADLYRVGDVTIDSKLQVAVFPAKVNQIVGLIEYAIVTEQGKTHESFLSTKIKPRDVHVAMLLLGVKPPVNVSVEIAWQEDGKWIRKSITNCIAQYPLEVASEQENKETGKSFELKPSSWIWTGSRVRPSGILTADELGSILSLQPDPDALSLINPMIDTSRFGSHVWSKQVPEKDSKVQIFIRPSETEKTPNPD